MGYQSIQLVDGQGSVVQDYRNVSTANRALIRAQAAGPQSQAIAGLADFVNLSSLALRVTSEVNALGVDAQRASWAQGHGGNVSSVGALIYVLCFNPRNGLPLAFGAVWVAGFGPDPSGIIRKYFRESNAEPGTPVGTDRVSKFIWRIS